MSAVAARMRVDAQFPPRKAARPAQTHMPDSELFEWDIVNL